MYEKFGRSLAARYQVHIVGQQAETSESSAIRVHGLPKVHSNPIKRIALQRQIYRIIGTVKPDVLIVGTPELIHIALLSKLMVGCRIVYDIRENYFRNFLYQSNYPNLLKRVLALGVRFTELTALPFFALVITAERCYKQEIKFLSPNALVLENKYYSLKPSPKRSPYLPGQKLRLVMTGTLSETFGIYQAMGLASALYHNKIDVELWLVGHVAGRTLKKHIPMYVNSLPFLNLVEGNPLLPHDEVLEQLFKADFALLSYPPNKSTENCIPTTLYECLANHIPMIIQRNPLWEKICNPHQAAVFIDYNNFDPFSLYTKLHSTPFYQNANTKMAQWENEEGKLLEAFGKLLDH